MTDQSISCPSCGEKIPLTSALRSEIEGSVRRQYQAALDARERELADGFERAREEAVARAVREAASKAEARLGTELAVLREQLKEQAGRLDEARRLELALRRRERELERQQQEIELAVARQLDEERSRVAAETRERLLEQHRLKDAEKERQLADMRRQIDDLRRKAEQGSQQLQGEAGEVELESGLRAAFPWDEITGVAQGVRGADVHHVVVDGRGVRCGAILWECKNARNWSDGWLQKLKADQRARRAEVAVLVTAALPKGCRRFGIVEGVLVTDFGCAQALAAVVRANLIQLAQARNAAASRGEKLELLQRYLSGTHFRHRVEAIVEAFARMREDLEAERRSAERQWAKRARQIEAVTFNISGMYGDLQGLEPALPPIAQLEPPQAAGDEEGARVFTLLSVRESS